MPTECGDGECGLDCAERVYPACGAGAEWAVHGCCSGGAVADAVSADAGVWAGAGAGVVADE